jgi:hypothetical protein
MTERTQYSSTLIPLQVCSELMVLNLILILFQNGCPPHITLMLLNGGKMVISFLEQPLMNDTAMLLQMLEINAKRVQR